MKPTHRLKLLDKTDDTRCEVGAGWINDDGSISITINPGVRLSKNKDQVLTLFKLDPTLSAGPTIQLPDMILIGTSTGIYNQDGDGVPNETLRKLQNYLGYSSLTHMMGELNGKKITIQSGKVTAQFVR